MSPVVFINFLDVVNNVLGEFVAAAIGLSLGFLISQIHRRLEERKTFKRGVVTAIDCCLDAEEMFKGASKGKEKFSQAVKLYMSRTGEKSRAEAEDIVSKAFGVSVLSHNKD